VLLFDNERIEGDEAVAVGWVGWGDDAPLVSLSLSLSLSCSPVCVCVLGGRVARVSEESLNLEMGVQWRVLSIETLERQLAKSSGRCAESAESEPNSGRARTKAAAEVIRCGGGERVEKGPRMKKCKKTERGVRRERERERERARSLEGAAQGGSGALGLKS
jgi:hypothetical protein